MSTEIQTQTLRAVCDQLRLRKRHKLQNASPDAPKVQQSDTEQVITDDDGMTVTGD